MGLKVYASKDFVEDKSIQQDCMVLVSMIQLPEVAKAFSNPNIEYGDGKTIVANGGSDTLLVSSNDGIDWTTASLPCAYSPYGITYGDGVFVAVLDTDQIGYSNDAITWQLASLPNFRFSRNWKQIAYGNGKFVAVDYANGYMICSEDGINWIEVASNLSKNYLQCVVFDGNRFVVMSDRNKQIFCSYDGITWTTVFHKDFENCDKVVFGNDKFVSAGHGRIDCAKWISSPYKNNPQIAWVECTPDIPGYWIDIAFGDNKFVVIALDGNGGNTAMYSENGVNWSVSKLPSNDKWNSISFAGDKFIAIAQNSSDMAISYDGISWSNYIHTSNGNRIVQNDLDVTERLKQVIGVPTTESVVSEVLAALPTWTGGSY